MKKRIKALVKMPKMTICQIPGAPFYAVLLGKGS